MIKPLDIHALDTMRSAATDFLLATSEGVDRARLTASAECTDYALCFRVYVAHLLQRHDLLDRDACSRRLRAAIRRLRAEKAVDIRGKPYRQLLTFTLSALAALGTLERDPLEDLVMEQIPPAVADELELKGCLKGVAGAGNQAMFLAIFLLHAQHYLGVNCSGAIQEWLDLHLSAMNARGMWSGRKEMSHLEFQNSYHQYEILEYMDVTLPRLAETKEAVLCVRDPAGHFAPYPGGGGCFDYDAVFLLTYEQSPPEPNVAAALAATAAALLAEQNDDGGYCESRCIAPWTPSGALRFARHVLSARGRDMSIERARYWLALSRPRHARIHTHWSRYSRAWNESDLWDTWFRMMAIARIDVALEPSRFSDWGFIDYPGIGFHPCVRNMENLAT